MGAFRMIVPMCKKDRSWIDEGIVTRAAASPARRTGLTDRTARCYTLATSSIREFASDPVQQLYRVPF